MSGTYSSRGPYEKKKLMLYGSQENLKGIDIWNTQAYTEDNIKINPRKIGCEAVNYIKLV
jgi:hypothetical protein